jgi:hypothetical protein
MRTLKPKYNAYWGVYDGYIRHISGTKRAIINRLKGINSTLFVDDLRILDEGGVVVYGDIEFGDTGTDKDFFTDDEWYEMTGIRHLSEEEIDRMDNREAEIVEPEVQGVECASVVVNLRDGSERIAVSRVVQDDEKEAVRKLQAVLARIDKGERFFFNITTLESKGLIKGMDHYCNNSCGKRERVSTTWHLTEKAKQFCNVVI